MFEALLGTTALYSHPPPPPLPFIFFFQHSPLPSSDNICFQGGGRMEDWKFLKLASSGGMEQWGRGSWNYKMEWF